MIEINITCVPLYFWGRHLNSAEPVEVRRLTKAVPDASSHSFFKCPTYGAGEPSVPPLSGLAEKKQRVNKEREKKNGREKKNNSREKRFKVSEGGRGE